MNSSVWSKKTLAVIAISALVGSLAPLSASAWEYDSDPDKIVTVSLELGDETVNGGGTSTCTGFGSLTIPLSDIAVVKERKYLKTPWTESTYDDDSDSGTPANNDDLDPSTPDPRSMFESIDEHVENTRTAYVSSEFVLRFDADNCESSDRTGAVWTERQPVERYDIGTYQSGTYWQPVELTEADGILDAETLRATANLLVDYNLLGANNVDVKLYNNILWEEAPEDRFDLYDWGTVGSYGGGGLGGPFGGLPVMWGTSGETTAKAVISIYGDTPVGKYRVRHGFTLDIGDYNSAPWSCLISGDCGP
jgi:hypothetical protein